MKKECLPLGSDFLYNVEIVAGHNIISSWFKCKKNNFNIAALQVTIFALRPLLIFYVDIMLGFK